MSGLYERWTRRIQAVVVVEGLLDRGDWTSRLVIVAVVVEFGNQLGGWVSEAEGDRWPPSK